MSSRPPSHRMAPIPIHVTDDQPVTEESLEIQEAAIAESFASLKETAIPGVAMFNYEAGGDDELSFRQGTKLTVRNEELVPKADWLYGYLGDREGFVPAAWINTKVVTEAEGGGAGAAAPTNAAEAEIVNGRYMDRYVIEGPKPNLEATSRENFRTNARDTASDRNVTLEFSFDDISMKKQAELMRSLEGAGHVEQLLDYHSGGPRMLRCLVFERTEFTMREFLLSQRLSNNEVTFAAYCILQGLHNLHEKSVVHGDICPETIGYANGVWKVTSFFRARPFGDVGGYTPARFDLIPPNIATIMQMEEPQRDMLLKGQKTQRDTDIWQFGLMLYEMSSGLRLLENTIQIVKFIASKDKLMLSGMGDPAALEIATRALDKEAFPLPHASELLEKRLFTNYARVNAKANALTGWAGDRGDALYDLARQKPVAQGQMELTINKSAQTAPKACLLIPGTPGDKKWDAPKDWNRDTFKVQLLCEWDGYHPAPGEPLQVIDSKLRTQQLAPLIVPLYRLFAVDFYAERPSNIVTWLTEKGHNVDDVLIQLPRLLEHKCNCVFDFKFLTDLQTPAIVDALYDLNDFLEAADRSKQYCGLQAVETTPGRKRWLCAEHAALHAAAHKQPVIAQELVRAVLPTRPARDVLNARTLRLKQAKEERARVHREKLLQQKRASDSARVMEVASAGAPKKRSSLMMVDTKVSGSKTRRSSQLVAKNCAAEGYLWKIGGIDKTQWEKRWFILIDDHLVYHKTKEVAEEMKNEPAGCIHVGGGAVRETTDPMGNGVGMPQEGKTIMLNALICSNSPKGREYALRADADDEHEIWMRLLLEAAALDRDFSIPCPYISLKRSAFGKFTDNLKGNLRKKVLKSPSKLGAEYDREEQPILEGVLAKLGSGKGKWQNRWFALQQNAIFYFVGAQDADPQGSINLTNTTSIMRFSWVDQPNGLLINTPTKMHVLASQTETEMHRWEQTIKTIIESLGGTPYDPQLFRFGYLSRQNALVEATIAFQARWCVLYNTELRLYPTHGDILEMKECVSLKGVTVSFQDPSLPQSNPNNWYFVLLLPPSPDPMIEVKNVVLCAPSKEDRNAWIDLLGAQALNA